MPLQATSGAASYDAFGGGVAAVPNYIEDVFSTYLYTGTGSSLTITNNIDLSTKGGMVWLKRRSGIANNQLYDTTRGATKLLVSNTTGAETTVAQGLTAFGTTGFTLGTNTTANTSAETYASWTFREQSKFFDVVTYTGNGAARTISHSLGSVPACIIVKQTSAAGEDWAVYHRGLPLVAGSLNDNFLTLNTTSAYSTSTDIWNRTVPTSTVFSVGNHPSTNSNGASYVAYLFAHDAGGFGLTGTDNVISCGSYTGNGSATGPTVTLGYEPQLVLIKRTDAANDWFVLDNMRGLVIGSGGDNSLFPNSTSGEDTNATLVGPTATGFVLEATAASVNASGGTYIYIAIRRGPMKVPTSGTSVYGANTWSGAGSTTFNSFAPDWATRFQRNATNVTNTLVSARLTGERYLITSSTSAETPDNVITFNNAGGGASVSFGASGDLVSYFFKRAPSFFDVACYTGTGSSTTQSHNLGAVPEMMVIRRRTGSGYLWVTYVASQGNTKFAYLNSDQAFATDSYLASTTPTSSVFTIGTNGDVNASGATYIAYLFATCAGVSKVGSYTGTGTTLQVNCGFTGGARFVLIKRTDSTGDWYVWDSARGIVAGNDPYLLLNSTAAEVTSTDYIDTYSAGFEISSTAPAAINASGGTFIFLAIA